MESMAASEAGRQMTDALESTYLSDMPDRMDMPDTERRSLLERVIVLLGDSGRVFAETEMVRDERTVRRWRSGEISIPDVVVRKLQWMERERTKGHR